MWSSLVSLRRETIVQVALALTVGMGLGCGGSVGGCGTLAPLPAMPAPVGLPFAQQIEGGGQVRITKPGFDKLTSVIPGLLGPGLTKGFTAPVQSQNLVIGKTFECSSNCGGGGCNVSIKLNPNLAPPGGIQVSMVDNTTQAVLHIKIAFDVDAPIPLSYNTIFTSCSSLCTLDLSAPGTVIDANIVMSIDKTTGQLVMALQKINSVNISLAASGCSVAGDILNFVLTGIDALLNSFIGNFIINLLTPQLNSLVQGFLPHPPGMAGVINTGKALASFDAPSTAALETYIVAGGYVSAYQGGLNLGLITGMNSDSDVTTRGPGETSDPALCVPARPAPDLTQAPYNLPANSARPDTTLAVAPEFAGMPDPMDSMGNTQDIALGLSRTFLDLTGFHVYNSGTLCLSISGGSLAALNAGALAVLVPSLGNIITDKKAPLAIVLRPEQPLTFTIGAGGMADPLLHVKVDDLRIDFYAFIEERYVRVFTLSATMDVMIDLQITMDMNGNPAILPSVTGIDKKSVKLAVLNTDLVNEDPTKLAGVLSSLVDIAVHQFMGSLKPVSLPSLMGFSLDKLSITRVQTTMDDFIAIYGTIVTGGTGPGGGPDAPQPGDWVPSRHTAIPVATTAKIVDVSVPPPDVIANAIGRGSIDPSNLPSVTLHLGAISHTASELEWQTSVDGGDWSAFTTEQRTTVTASQFLLQGHHTIEARARLRGDWASLDPNTVKLPVIIDSAPPTLHPTVELGALVFHGEDNVSLPGALRYAWQTPEGWTDFGPALSMPLDGVFSLTHDGVDKLHIAVIDETGNRGEIGFDPGPAFAEFHGRTTNPPTSGCGCALGGRAESEGGNLALALLALLPLAGLAWRRRPSARTLLIIGILSAGAAGMNVGCNCNQSTQLGCKVPDDCRTTKCDTGTIPQCMTGGMCACTPDLPLGDIGQYASLGMRGGVAYLAAYNNTYGDLMIGHVAPPGVVTNWEFVDGIPLTSSPDNPLSQVRGGISDPGDDVGKYASIAVNNDGNPVIAYYDATNGALRFASFGAVLWHSHAVDVGVGAPPLGDNFGRWASITLDKSGAPGIAYYAEVAKGASGMREGQLRFAQAKVANPASKTDWTISTIETRALPPPPMGGGEGDVLPDGIGIMASTARKSDDGPVIAYYDRMRGNLRYVEFDNAGKKWGTPIILDGEDASGNDTGDVGQYASVASDGVTSHITYVDATRDNLLYVDTKDKTPEVVDDGFRPKDETTNDGLPAPVYHLVGDSSSLQLSGSQAIVAYQDSTVEELRFGVRDMATKKWTLTTVAGHGTPFKGSYGFYAQARVSGGVAVLSSYALNQHMDNPDFYVETFAINLGGIM